MVHNEEEKVKAQTVWIRGVGVVRVEELRLVVGQAGGSFERSGGQSGRFANLLDTPLQ
jgi:hypothetical protein